MLVRVTAARPLMRPVKNITPRMSRSLLYITSQIAPSSTIKADSTKTSGPPASCATLQLAIDVEDFLEATERTAPIEKKTNGREGETDASSHQPADADERQEPPDEQARADHDERNAG